MNYIFRIINVVVCAISAKFVFDGVWKEYYSYLPSYDKLVSLNETSGIGSILRENSMGLRELYNHAFERSIIYALLAFIVLFLLIEYVYRSNHKQREGVIKTMYEALGSFKERNKPKDV